MSVLCIALQHCDAHRPPLIEVSLYDLLVCIGL